MSSKIGVAITSYDRPQLLDKCIENWEKYLPEDSVLIVVKDIQGIAKAKNWCLKLLEDEGVTDYFLSDDDCWPISDNWYKPFIDSKEPYLLYNFDLPGNSLKELYRDDKVVAYDKTRGCLQYFKQIVLDTVGGFDEAFGLYGYEHPSLAWRIFNAGLTTHRSMSVVDCDQLFYCEDKNGTIPSSLSSKIKEVSMRNNFKLYRQSKTSKEYIPYK